jgi:GNAT superfamily N-acetyltransferase
MEISCVTAEEAHRRREGLIALLRDVVDGGASVGFLPPLREEEARVYWDGVIDALRGPGRLLWIARDGDVVVGTVQLDLCGKGNGLHRAEIMKLLVHSAHRRRGVARALMNAAEAEARRIGRTLLVLDTRAGDAAEPLYRSLGWICSGVIPQYARNGEGGLDPSAFYYKLL